MLISGHFHVLGMRKPHFQCNANREVATTSLVFLTSRTYCTFFLWSFYVAPYSHPGQSITLLWLERQSSKCANLPTVATSNNKSPRRANFISACSRHTGVVHHAHPVRGESHIQHNANWEAATLAERLG